MVAVADIDQSDADLLARVRRLLADVPDPEIPVISVVDLGIVRGARLAGATLVVDIAPTYSGCPATEVIEASIAEKLEASGYADVSVRRQLAPPWTTDWISEAGREKLRAFGIAPPPSSARLRGESPPIACPHCASTDTLRLSEFGSTPCKAAWRCSVCGEPFDYFKCI